MCDALTRCLCTCGAGWCHLGAAPSGGSPEGFLCLVVSRRDPGERARMSRARCPRCAARRPLSVLVFICRCKRVCSLCVYVYVRSATLIIFVSSPVPKIIITDFVSARSGIGWIVFFYPSCHRRARSHCQQSAPNEAGRHAQQRRAPRPGP